MRPISKATLKRLRSLKTPKGRREHGLFLAEGYRLVASALEAGAPVVELLLREDVAGSEAVQSLVERARQRNGLRVSVVPEGQWSELSTTERSQGVLAVVEMPGWPESAPWRSGLMLALNEVRDPGNLGTIWRAAAWFAADRIVLGKGCVEPHNPKVVRGSMGGLFYVPGETVEDLVNWLAAARAAGYRIVAADPAGELTDWPAEFREAVLVVGGETAGLAGRFGTVVETSVRIPRWGAGDSLNVAMATCVLLDRWRRAVSRDDAGG